MFDTKHKWHRISEKGENKSERRSQKGLTNIILIDMEGGIHSDLESGIGRASQNNSPVDEEETFEVWLKERTRNDCEIQKSLWTIL